MSAEMTSPPLPVATSGETVTDIVARAGRKSGTFPLRRTFLQGQDENGKPVPGPLAGLVSASDHRALILYLLLVTKASAPPWDAGLPAPVWARALGLPDPQSKTATSTISKVWTRLERHQLVSKRRRGRVAAVTLLNEDGSGQSYTAPDGTGPGGRYIRIPAALWVGGPDLDNKPDLRWYQVLTLAELAVLLIARSHGDGFRLPFEEGPSWYGISADTIARGVHQLGDHGLLATDKTYKKAPLSPAGYTAEHRYTLQAPFGPMGKASESRTWRRTRVKS